MDNLSKTLDFIKTNAVSSDLAALDWNRFAKNNPQVYTFNQYQQFLEWGGSKYIDAETLRKLWQGKEITDAYFYLRDENENKQMQENGQVNPANENTGFPVSPLLVLPLIFLSKHYNQSKIMEEDDEYQVIVLQKKSEWLNNNPNKDFSSKEGLDYIYGSLENKETPALEKDVKTEIEKKKASDESFRKRFEKKEKRWEKEKTKVYKNPKDNPLYAYKEKQVDEHTKARFKLLKKENPSIKEEDIRKQIQPSAFNQVNQIRQLQGAANRIQQIQRVQTPPPPPQAPSPSPSPAPRPSSMPSPSSAISNVKNMVRLAQNAQKILKAARLATLLANPYVWIIIGVAVVVIIVFAIVFGSDSETNQTQLTGYCPNPETIAANRKTTPETCKYLNPAINIFGNLTEQQIDAYKEKYRAQSKRLDFDARVNDIVNKARGVGLNPVIFLGYWKSEGNFSFSFGCDPRTPPFTFEAELDCTLGLSPNGGSATARCARSAIEKDPNKKKELEKGCELLKSIRKNKVYSNYPISYPINTFDDFAETYGSAAPDLGDAATNFNCVNTYNTLVEVANNLNACTAISQKTNIPPFNPLTGYQDIVNQFNIKMIGFDEQHLQWAWEKLWEISETNFINLVKGTTVQADSSSWQETCRIIHLKQFPQEELFKVVLTHELGHIVRWCNPNSLSKIGDLPNAIANESYVTYYSTNAVSCTGSDSFNEDYAEMLTYYLNPSSNSQTAACVKNESNPYLNNKHLFHYNIANGVVGSF